jgi:hypothetical protein
MSALVLQVEMWAQCGGKSGAGRADAADPAICCPLSADCVNVNEWCVEGPSASVRL